MGEDCCIAQRGDGHRCTRRKKPGSQFCGTHLRGTPHGIYQCNNMNRRTKKVEIWLEDLNGINYYVDGHGNVYQPEHVIQSLENPKTVGTISGPEHARILVLYD